MPTTRNLSIVVVLAALVAILAINCPILAAEAAIKKAAAAQPTPRFAPPIRL